MVTTTTEEPFMCEALNTAFYFNSKSSSYGGACTCESISVKFRLIDSSEYSNSTAKFSVNGDYSTNCQFWRVMVVVLMENDWQSTQYLLQIQNFLNGVTRNCDAHSTLQIFDPGRVESNGACSLTKMTSTQQLDLVAGLSLSDTITPQGKEPGDQLEELLEQVYMCATESPLATGEAGVIYVLTDVDCDALCQSQKLRVDAQTITEMLVEKRFIMEYMFLTDDIAEGGGECYAVWACAKILFDTCSRSSTSQCSVNIYGNRTTSLSSAMQPSMACATKKTLSAADLSTAELAIIIGVPCLCLTVVCSVCAVFCYKRTKYSTRRWRRFFQTHSTSHHNNVTAAFDPQLPHPASLTMANHYMDLRTLAESSKKDQWEVMQNNVIIHENELLGNGAFAVVHKATLKGKIPLMLVNPRLNLVSEHEQDDGSYEAAVKRLPGHANDQNRMDFFHEINFMKNLGYHTHVISMLGCISCPIMPMILVEYCEYGDLLRFLRKHRDLVLMDKDDVCPIDADLCLRIKDLVSISWQVSDGLTYLSSKNFIHRDVAARNVLITKHLVAKVSDFGLGRYADSALYTARGGRLPFKSMALEALKLYEFSEKTDVWAFAILLFEIFSLGDVPYATVQPMDMISHITEGNRPPQPEKCPDEVYNIMKKCWDADPNNRPVFAEIRGELTILLNIDDESYGYLNLDSEKSRQLRNMIHRQDDKEQD
ncbi:unnamed protein product [Heligmosomoides polygyrus]|uniref:Protein kinase domain-containing protein n=1 Tax=Heligmosomoides polygyrus TaxID=6339 RepID=A0A3P7X1L8_HELPZ|nr:unnamed protein product [Heligmosomoides polygyrus]